MNSQRDKSVRPETLLTLTIGELVSSNKATREDHFIRLRLLQPPKAEYIFESHSFHIYPVAQ